MYNKEDDEEVLDQRLLLDGHGHELPELGHNPRLFGQFEEFEQSHETDDSD